MTNVYSDALTKKQLVSIAEPFYLNGVLLADIELTVADAMIERSKPETGNLDLYTQGGITIASTTSSSIQDKLNSDAELSALKVAINNKSESLEYVYQNMNAISYFENIKLSDDINWTVVMTADKDIIFAKENAYIFLKHT
ncbi:hypothetical protein JI57_01335 [Psychromonas sp. PRT-SC03]|nr:hypothetical protein JI57_01335 [Psychromonas sp. PRT-SC03]